VRTATLDVTTTAHAKAGKRLRQSLANPAPASNVAP
jgi:hypothetical protein